MTNLQIILTSVLTSSGVASIIQYVLHKTLFSKIEHRRQTGLESYKHELSKISEQQKFDYQKWITDSNVFTQKRHAVYSELYRLILVADSSLEGLVGVRIVPSFEEYSKTDMEKYLCSYPVVEGYIEKLVNGWEQDNQRCIKEIREYLTIIDFQKADNARQEAKNHFLVNNLYISEEVERIVIELFSLLVNQYVIERQQTVDHNPSEELPEEIKKIKERKNTLLQDLKKCMRKELSTGFYKI